MLKHTFLGLLITLNINNAMAQPDVYQLQVKSENVTYKVYLNGFPVYEGSDTQYSKMTLPVQLYLIGKNNEFAIEAEPIDNTTKGQIVGYIDPFKKGQIIDVGQEKDSKERLLHLEVGHKQRESIKFDNEVFDFSNTLTKGDKLTKKQVMAYAKKLYSYLEKGDAAGFVKEMELKVLDYSSANEYSAQEMRDGLTGQMQHSFFAKKYEAITEDRIALNSFNENRIWEIKVDNHDFLKYDEDGGSFQMAIYVASINGKLGIVR